MARIVISENITLDGVVQDPTGDEGFARGGWFHDGDDEAGQGWAEVETGEALNAEALLLGRRSYEYLVARWPQRTGVWADRLNSMPKYVVSATLADPVWAATTVLTGDAVDEVTSLKERLEGEIVLNGSGRLARTLIEHDLVDEFRLMVYPFVLGCGERLFPETPDRTALRLTDTRTVGGGLALVTYDVVRGG